MRKLSAAAIAILSVTVIASPAWAGAPPVGTPGPLIGAGVPALAGLAYIYRRVRKSRAS